MDTRLEEQANESVGQPGVSDPDGVRSSPPEMTVGHEPGTCYVCEQMRSIHEKLDSCHLDLVAAVADEVMPFHGHPMVVDEHGDFELADIDAFRREHGFS
jgi:hypothetical protein